MLQVIQSFIFNQYVPVCGQLKTFTLLQDSENSTHGGKSCIQESLVEGLQRMSLSFILWVILKHTRGETEMNNFKKIIFKNSPAFKNNGTHARKFSYCYLKFLLGLYEYATPDSTNTLNFRKLP